MNLTSFIIIAFIVVGFLYVLDWTIPYIQRRWLIDRNIVNAVVDLSLDPSSYCPTRYSWVKEDTVYTHHAKSFERAEISLRTTGLFLNGSQIKIHKVTKIIDGHTHRFYELRLDSDDDFEFNLLFMLFLRDNQEFIPKYWGRISDRFDIYFRGTLFKRKIDEYAFTCCPILCFNRGRDGIGRYGDYAISTAF